MTTPERLQVGIVGGGAVATALAHELGRADANCDVLVWARHPDALSRALVDAGGTASVTDDLFDVATRPTVIVAVSDDAIAAVAARLRIERHGAPGPSVVLHTSGATTGAWGMPALGPADDASVNVVRGSLHPLVAVGRAPAPPAPPAPPGRFEGMPFVIEAEALEGVLRARQIVERLGGEVIALPSMQGDPAEDARAKARYHAAATMVATGVVTLVDRAAAELAGTDAERAAFRSAFARLAAGAAANVMEQGGADVLTGPIARSDQSTLDLHAEALEGSAIEALYVAVRRAAEEMLRDASE